MFMHLWYKWCTMRAGICSNRWYDKYIKMVSWRDTNRASCNSLAVWTLIPIKTESSAKPQCVGVLRSSGPFQQDTVLVPGLRWEEAPLDMTCNILPIILSSSVPVAVCWFCIPAIHWGLKHVITLTTAPMDWQTYCSQHALHRKHMRCTSWMTCIYIMLM